MTSMKRLLAVALAGAVLLSSVAAAGVGSSATANESLDIAVENAGNDGAIVTVTQNGSAAANASVNVALTDNGSYAGVGDYTTDENGTVSLPEPDENVTVEVTAAKDNVSATTTVTLTAAEKTDDGEDDEQKSFGQMVSSFVDEMLNAGENGGPLGQAISDFVTSNNPGADKKPDHAGKPADAGTQNNSSAEKGSQGPPENAGSDEGNGNGHGNDESKGNNGNGNGNDRGGSNEETTTATTESDE